LCDTSVNIIWFSFTDQNTGKKLFWKTFSVRLTFYKKI
jgi:hypothetical protein